MKVGIYAPHTRCDVTYAALQCADVWRRQGHDVSIWSPAPRRLPVDAYWDQRARRRHVGDWAVRQDHLVFFAPPEPGLLFAARALARTTVMVTAETLLTAEHVECAHAFAVLDHLTHAPEDYLLPDIVARAQYLTWAPGRAPTRRDGPREAVVLSVGAGDAAQNSRNLGRLAESLCSGEGHTLPCVALRDGLTHAGLAKLRRLQRLGANVSIFSGTRQEMSVLTQNSCVFVVVGVVGPYGVAAWDALAGGARLCCQDPGTLGSLGGSTVLSGFGPEAGVDQILLAVDTPRAPDLEALLEARRELLEAQLGLLTEPL